MTQRKNYEAPAMELVELKLQGSLLAGSSLESTSFGDEATLNDFDDTWE